MQEIITILIMAMNLLTAVQSNPNLPVEFRTVAVSVANNAIAFANQQLTSQPTTTSQVVTPVATYTPPVIQEQPVGGIITPMKPTLSFERLTIPSTYYVGDELVNGSYYAWNLTFKDEKGKTLKGGNLIDKKDCATYVAYKNGEEYPNQGKGTTCGSWRFSEILGVGTYKVVFTWRGVSVEDNFVIE